MIRKMVLTMVAVVCLSAPLAARDDAIPAFIEGKPKVAAKEDDELHRLLKERCNVARSELKAHYLVWQANRGRAEDVFAAGRRLLESELELCEKPTDRVGFRGQYLELAREVERVSEARFAAEKISERELDRVRYERLDAQIQLLKEKKAAEAKRK